MSIHIPSPVPHEDKDTFIERKIKKSFSLLRDKKKYLSLKKDAPQKQLCDSVSRYMRGEYREACIRLYELLGIARFTAENEVHRNTVKRILKELKDPQTTLNFQ
jgi:hypothetical protein